MFRLVLIAIGSTLLLGAQQAPQPQGPPMPDFTPANPLFRALLRGNHAEAERLLKEGANPNEGRFLGANSLITAAMQGDFAMARVLLEHGVDISATDAAGSTALMWAAAAEVPDAAIIDELIRRGADPNAKNKSGDTAIHWALRRGYTPVVDALKRGGASDNGLVRDAVERAVALLQKTGPEFVKVSGCVSCHNQSLPQMTVALAREHGIASDRQISEKQAKTVVAVLKPFREPMLAGTEALPNPAISLSYLLIGLGVDGFKADETTAAMAHLVSKQQMPDGSFAAFRARPPMESSIVSATALSIRALQLYGGENSKNQIARASAWLRTAGAATTEERAMKLLGLTWAKAPAADVQKAAKALLAEQRQDGGWGQLTTLESDAYATGQVLYALMTSGQITAAGPVYSRGSAFLLRTQLPDGSWLVRSRVFPFQPYHESGFPHGKHQWISASGTSWAAMALLAAMPPVDQHVSQVF